FGTSYLLGILMPRGPLRGVMLKFIFEIGSRWYVQYSAPHVVAATLITCRPLLPVVDANNALSADAPMTSSSTFHMTED
ncbi:hypothetical protein PoB_000196600, partial [Plakobranchus ocellatus]